PPRPTGPQREMNGGLPGWVREEFIRRVAVELNLSPQQEERIMKTVRESQERIRELYSLVGPEIRDELDYVRESIRAELNPEQARRFDEIRDRQGRLAEMGRSGPLRPPFPQNPAGGPRAPLEGNNAQGQAPPRGQPPARPSDPQPAGPTPNRP